MTEAERAAAQAIFAEQVKTYEARLREQERTFTAIVQELEAEKTGLNARVQELEQQNSFFLKALKEEYACPYSRCKYDFGAELDEWGCSAEDHQSCWVQAAKEAGK